MFRENWGGKARLRTSEWKSDDKVLFPASLYWQFLNLVAALLTLIVNINNNIQNNNNNNNNVKANSNVNDNSNANVNNNAANVIMVMPG